MKFCMHCAYPVRHAGGRWWHEAPDGDYRYCGWPIGKTHGNQADVEEQQVRVI